MREYCGLLAALGTAIRLTDWGVPAYAQLHSKVLPQRYLRTVRRLRNRTFRGARRIASCFFEVLTETHCSESNCPSCIQGHSQLLLNRPSSRISSTTAISLDMLAETASSEQHDEPDACLQTLTPLRFTTMTNSVNR